MSILHLPTIPQIRQEACPCALVNRRVVAADLQCFQLEMLLAPGALLAHYCWQLALPRPMRAVVFQSTQVQVEA
jgi:hypothetical protein